MSQRLLVTDVDFLHRLWGAEEYKVWNPTLGSTSESSRRNACAID